jgi:hypothetical protein
MERAASRSGEMMSADRLGLMQKILHRYAKITPGRKSQKRLNKLEKAKETQLASLISTEK